MSTRILRLRRTEEGKAGQHLLLQISQTGKPLDLKLVGTEQEYPYHATIKESSAKSLQSSKFTGDLDEWKKVLRFAFFHDRPEGPLPELLQGVEAVGAISGSSLTVTIRKNIGGIHQSLGSVKLQKDESLELDLFDWIDQAVATSDELCTALETLQASVSGQQEQVAKLNKQLDELVKAKKEHEDELLKKFAALLNAKKLKIRDQQRLLAGAKVDPKAAEAVGEARNASVGKGRKAAASRNGKRKATKSAEPDEEDDDEDEDVNDGQEDAPDDNDGRPAETPPRSDGEQTEDEDDLDNMDDLAAVVGPSKSASNGQRTRNDASQKMDVDEFEELPPKRTLPFAKKGAEPVNRPDPPPPAAGGDDEEEETDDEL